MANLLDNMNKSKLFLINTILFIIAFVATMVVTYVFISAIKEDFLGILLISTAFFLIALAGIIVSLVKARKQLSLVFAAISIVLRTIYCVIFHFCGLLLFKAGTDFWTVIKSIPQLYLFPYLFFLVWTALSVSSIILFVTKPKQEKGLAILGKRVFIDGSTGLFAFNKSLLDYQTKKTSAIDFDKYRPPFSEYKTTSVTFCINLSDSCNLSCDYCFNLKKNNKSVSLEDALKFLDTCFETFKNKEKYYVDLSGKGEPLLYLNKILEIKRYCDEKSNELKREVLVQLVCNGTLLDSLTADILQKNGILFGVSLDGCEFVHDKHRKTKDCKPTYQLILDNVNNIPHHEYVGAACTLTSDVFSLKDSLIELSKTFNTVSYKPSRDCDFAFDEQSIDGWLASYDELVLFLASETIRGNLKYIRILLNGEDYLGKFIRRMVLGQRNIIRCDAGLSRFCLDDDGKIYSCPAAFSEESLCVGNKDSINFKQSEALFKKQLNKKGCGTCVFRNICGGECQLEKILSKGINKTMCKYKSHLILLSMYFVNEVHEHNSLSFKEIYDFCIEVENRKKIDINLERFLKNNPQYSFIEGKRIYDKQEKKY